jgi:hypothetical protein
MKRLSRTTTLITLLFLTSASSLFAASLDIETDYRLRGVSFSAMHFDTTVSTDSCSYYSQRLQLSIRGNFVPDIEIGTKLTALGVAGSSSTFIPVNYPNTSMQPFIETAYVKINNFAEQPINVTMGKQNIAIGNGMIFDDNGIGFTGFKIHSRYDWRLPWETTLFSYKVADNFKPNTDQDIFGLTCGTFWKEQLIEVSYFQQQDFSGTVYTKGQPTSQDPANTHSMPTSRIVKTFLDLHLKHEEKIAGYDFEIAKQGGVASALLSDTVIPFDSMGYVISGKLIGEKTKLGKVKATASFAYASGDDNLGLSGTDKAFSPDLCRRYNGLERSGFGELQAATPMDMFLPVPSAYSGINTLSMGAEFTPLYAWTFGVVYYLYSGSQGPKGAPEASGLERIFGAEFSLGEEMNLSVKFEYSKYCEIRFSFSRYTPPVFEAFWPKRDPATRTQLEVATHF